MTSPAPYPDTVAIDYIIEGAQHAGDVAAGKGALLGVAIGSPSSPNDAIRFVDQDIPTALQQYSGRSRIYLDTVLARVIERKYGLPTGPYHDLRTMCALAARASGHSPAPELGLEQSSLASTQLESATNLMILVHELRSAEAWGAMLRAEQVYVYWKIELPVIEPTCSMILSGIKVDRSKLNKLRIRKEPPDIIRHMAGRRVDLRNDEDIRRLLFRELRLPVVVRCQNGQPSPSLDALELIRGQHPIVPPLIDWKREDHLRSAAERLSEELAGSDRVHGWLDPLGCDTGRFSCRGFNLQGLSRGIRQALVPNDGEVFIEADIDQCELRVLGYLAQDPVMLGAFQRGEDLHQLTASLVLQRPAELITSADRTRIGKPLNFGMVYGVTARGLAERLGVGLDTAQSWINCYFATYSGVAAWKQRVMERKSRLGHAETLSGRRRHIHERGAGGDRKAINSTVQGTAADILKLRIPCLPPQYRLVMTNHDSVLFAVPTSAVDDAKRTIGQIMCHCEEWPTLPLSVTVSEGATWGDCYSDRSRAG